MSDTTNKWDGQPTRPGGWHLLRRIARPEYRITERDVPWWHDPSKVLCGDACPWIRPNIDGPDHAYRVQDVGRHWRYVGPMEVLEEVRRDG